MIAICYCKGLTCLSSVDTCSSPVQGALVFPKKQFAFANLTIYIMLFLFLFEQMDGRQMLLACNVIKDQLISSYIEFTKSWFCFMKS